MIQFKHHLVVMEIDNVRESITDEKELLSLFQDIEQRCFKLDNFQEPGMPLEDMIEKLMVILQSIKDLQMFSPNQTIKQVHTEHLKLLTLPYHIGWLYGRLSEPRMKAVTTCRDFLTTFLQLMEQFNCQEEEVFPKILSKMWHEQTKQAGYRPSRQELVQAMKQRKLVQNRYAQSQKIKEESDRRQSIRDYLTIQIHESITMLRTIEEEISILQYKESIKNDPIAKQQYENEIAKPLPKMKVWQVPPKEEVKNFMCPSEHRKDIVAQVWQENANKPTMTLDEVADLQIQNMMEREARQAKHREENKQDTDSDKEEVDERMKKKARAWDDWKDSHEKGAGNRNGR